MPYTTHEPIEGERPDPESHRGILLALVELADKNAGHSTMFAPHGEYEALRALMDTGSVTLLEKTMQVIWHHGRAYGGAEVAGFTEHQASEASHAIHGLMQLAEAAEDTEKKDL